MPEAVGPSPGAVSVRYQSSDTRLLVGLAGAGVGGYLLYRYVYVPWRIKQDYEAQVLAYQRRTGASSADALAQVGAQACQAIAMGYGVRPQGSGAICGVAGGAAAEILRQVPNLVNQGILQPSAQIGTNLYGTGKALVDVGVTALTTPIKILGGPVKPLDFVVFPIGVTKLTTKGVVAGAKGIASGAKAVGKFLGKIF